MADIKKNESSQQDFFAIDKTYTYTWKSRPKVINKPNIYDTYFIR